MVYLIQLLKEIITEGGNVFDSTSNIRKEYIQPTLTKFFSVMYLIVLLIFEKNTYNPHLLNSQLNLKEFIQKLILNLIH